MRLTYFIPNFALLTGLYLMMQFLIPFKAVSQELPIDPLSCGYSCSAKDVILSEPYLASDPQGTPIETCVAGSGTTFTAYVAFKMENTTGSLRYTPMIQADLNIDGNYHTVSSCYPAIQAGTSRIYTSPQAYEFQCGSAVSLEKIWMGWNVSSKDCEYIASVSQCNKLIPSGKCGDYNSIPEYLLMTVNTPLELGEENTASRCTDGIDNDGNGLSDCDDFACAKFTECSYTPTSSGKDGGLESNSRLLEKIARRYYQRSSKPSSKSNILEQGNEFKYAITPGFGKSSTGKNISLASFIPTKTSEGAIGYVSSPEDLNDITNARQTLSVDYFNGSDRTGAILATLSENGVYEHTKVICDRVLGSRLAGIWKVPLYDNYPFLISKLERPEGSVEYSCSFSVLIDEAEDLQVENHWNVASYPEADTYYNFQVWAANTAQLRDLVDNLMNRVTNLNGKLPKITSGEMPEVYIAQSQYKNRVLEFEVVNPNGRREVAVNGVLQRTETQQSETIQWVETLDGSPRQHLRFMTEGIYSLGLTFSPASDRPSDTIFFADGVWALDPNSSKEAVSFQVYQDLRDTDSEQKYVERDLQIRGTVKEKIAWYRSLRNNFQAVSLNEYEGLSFETRSEIEMELEVVLAVPGQDWDRQLRTFVQIPKGEKEHFISWNTFKGDAGQLEQIHMLVFQMTTDGNESAVSLELKRMSLTNLIPNPVGQVLYEAPPNLQITPNPVQAGSQMRFKSNASGSAICRVFNTTGRNMGQFGFTVQAGSNEVGFKPMNLAAGVYLAEISCPDGSRLQTQIVIP